jgi:hypothetical protein
LGKVIHVFFPVIIGGNNECGYGHDLSVLGVCVYADTFISFSVMNDYLFDYGFLILNDSSN